MKRGSPPSNCPPPLSFLIMRRRIWRPMAAWSGAEDGFVPRVRTELRRVRSRPSRRTSQLHLGELELVVAVVDDVEALAGVFGEHAGDLAGVFLFVEEKGAAAAVGGDPGFQVLDVLVAEEDGAFGLRALEDFVLRVEVLAAPVHLPHEQALGGRAALLVVRGDEGLL